MHKTLVLQTPKFPKSSETIGDHHHQRPKPTGNYSLKHVSLRALPLLTCWLTGIQQEKLRHQKQYPNYRYKPRRSGRSSSLGGTTTSASPTDVEARRCAKCGGRSITTPLTMSTPGLPSNASNTPITPLSANHPPDTPSTGSSAHRFLKGLNSPQVHGQARFQARPNSSSNNFKALQLASPRHPDRDALPSPDPKRRRVANGTYQAVRVPNGQLTPFPFPQNRRESLPRPDFMPYKNNTFSMGPPPKPINNRSHPDSSLKLPPLKTSSTTLDSSASTRASSVEAMIMSIHPLNKIRVLAKISPPLPATGPSSPAHRVRGFAIAIDGSDMESVDQLTESLTASLSLQHPVRVFESPVNHVFKGPRGKEGAGGEAEGKDFLTYLHIISEYHILSKEITSYITTYPPHPTLPPRSSLSPVSPKSQGDGHPSVSKTGPRAHTSPNHDRDGGPSTEVPTGVPIALLPCFQLSHTNIFASQVPITDNYAPVDHWQWMASLWRGIIGPDVTITVLPALHPTAPHSTIAATAAISSSGSGGSSGSAGTTTNNNNIANNFNNINLNSEATPVRMSAANSSSKSGGGNMTSSSSGVEARLEDARAVLVRGEIGKTGIGEGKLRRVGFEVGEWVRGGDEGRRGS